MKLNVLNYGGGWQTIGILVLIEQGKLPRPDRIVIADTGREKQSTWYWRTNGSNLVSAAVDSAVFLSLLAAFGGLPWVLVPLLAFGQWGAKLAGGAIWAYVLRPRGNEVHP